MAKNKPVTMKQFRRMLIGRNYAFCTGIVCMCLSPLMLLWPADGRDPAETVNSAAVSFFIGLVISLVFCMRPVRSRRVLRHLRRFGELEDALADLNSPEAYHVPYIQPLADTAARTNVMGSRFVFLFSVGRVIHYYQIARMDICRVENRLQLNITDTNGKSYSLFEADGSRIASLSHCVRQLYRRYPGCPRLTRSDEQVYNI